jgi:hypothetical protein
VGQRREQGRRGWSDAQRAQGCAAAAAAAPTSPSASWPCKHSGCAQYTSRGGSCRSGWRGRSRAGGGPAAGRSCTCSTGGTAAAPARRTSTAVGKQPLLQDVGHGGARDPQRRRLGQAAEAVAGCGRGGARGGSGGQRKVDSGAGRKTLAGATAVPGGAGGPDRCRERAGAAARRCKACKGSQVQLRAVSRRWLARPAGLLRGTSRPARAVSRRGAHPRARS